MCVPKTVVDNSKKAPTVEFIFPQNWYDEVIMPRPSGERANPAITNRNDWISFADFVIIRISEKDLENEIFLPKTPAAP